MIINDTSTDPVIRKDGLFIALLKCYLASDERLFIGRTSIITNLLAWLFKAKKHEVFRLNPCAAPAARIMGQRVNGGDRSAPP